MDLIWLPIAFVCGFIVRQVGLPPLVGFLAAGFAAEGLGVEGGEALEKAGDFGVTLLLFTIGLKLNVKSLLRPQVWAVASGHMVITTVVFGGGIFLLSVAGFSLFATLDFGVSILMAFALSFSSTVFAVKVLEDRGEMSSAHGRVAIGVLIMQDIFAVVFMTISSGKVPSPWALALVGLFAARPLLATLMRRAGHGELLMLYGLFLAVGTYELFELVRLKGDLGALIIGVMLASTPKAGELAKSLLSFKDLLLVGFFLSIGLTGAPTLEAVGIAALFGILMPLKVFLFFRLLTFFRMRARTSLKASFNLANYSEFGLIVAVVGLRSGWITGEWCVILAIALSFTFVAASILNSRCDKLFTRFASTLRGFESKKRLPEDELIDPGPAEVVILGMGRIGTAAYDEMRERRGDVILGIESNEDTVRRHQEQGRNVILGDATDPELYERRGGESSVELALLTMHNLDEMLRAVHMMKGLVGPGKIVAAVRFEDQIEPLREAGVAAVYSIYSRAGVGFAASVDDRSAEPTDS